MFSRKKIILIASTIILLASVVATAIVLTRRQSKIPVSAAGELQISPVSGNWNHPESFLVKNGSSQTISVHWYLDCWDTTFCSDSEGNQTLAPQQTFTKGLGDICSKWQLDLTWPGDSWGGIAEKATTGCDVVPSPTPSPTPPLESPSITPSPTEPPIGGPDPSPTPTPTNTPGPSQTPTPGPSSTPPPDPTSTPGPQPTPTPTPAVLLQSGSLDATLILTVASAVLLGLGALLAL